MCFVTLFGCLQIGITHKGCALFEFDNLRQCWVITLLTVLADNIIWAFWHLVNVCKWMLKMTCIRLIYLAILLFLATILVVIFHLNMLLTLPRDQLYFDSLPPKNISFEIDQMLAFDRLIKFFNLFKSPTPPSPAEESDKFIKFISKSNIDQLLQIIHLFHFILDFAKISKSKFINLKMLNSSILFEIKGNSTQKPFLIGVDLDVENLDNWSRQHRHFQVDYIKEHVTGIGTMSSKSIVMVS